MLARRDEISHVVRRAEQLALALHNQPLQPVLCHTDLHAGNLLLASDGALYLVDWDNPLLAPKERDLMFIGGGVDDQWDTVHQTGLFYQGYGKTEINPIALAYYRYERIVQDFAEECKLVLLTDEGGQDRERVYRFFTSNFLPGNAVEIARQSDDRLSLD